MPDMKFVSFEARADPPRNGELVVELRRVSPMSLLRGRTANTFSTANNGMSSDGRSSSSSSSVSNEV